MISSQVSSLACFFSYGTLSEIKKKQWRSVSGDEKRDKRKEKKRLHRLRESFFYRKDGKLSSSVTAGE